MNIDPQYLDFKTDGLIENKATPFYCKHVAIIGHLDNFDDIEELASLLWQHGATVSSHVTPYTDIVINGIDADEEDMLLIRQMQANGANLKVYFQEDFECMLSEYHLLDWYSGGTPTIEKKSGKECSKSQNLDRIVFPETKRESNTQETNTEPIKDESNDKLQETIKKLGEIFPDAVKDGEVDFDKLKKEATEHSEEYEQQARAAAKLTEEEMIGIARQAVISVYGLTDEQMAMMGTDEEIREESTYWMLDGKPVYSVWFWLLQDTTEYDDPSVFPEFTEKDGIYTVDVNVETGVIEEIYYESGMGGNG